MGPTTPRKSTRAGKVRSITPSPKTRRKPAPSNLKRRLRRRDPVESGTAAVDALRAHRDDPPEDADECLADARSIFECAALCLTELADPHQLEGATCELSDVNVLVRLGIKRILRAQASLDLCDVGGAA